MRIVGIDPGVAGALAWLEDGELMHLEDMPAVDKHVNAALVYQILIEHPADIAAIEAVHAMHKMNPTALFKLGQAHGICLGATADLRQIPARAQVWKRHYSITGERKDQKAAARRIAIDRWPAFADHFKRVKDADRAEAALIALWAHETTTQTKEQAA